MTVDFMNPSAFLLLLLIPIFFIGQKIGLFTHVTFPLTFSDWEGYVFSWHSKRIKFAEGLSFFFVLIGFFCVVISFAEPVIHHQQKVYTTRGTDILFLLDTSPSMASRDINGNTRFDAARKAIHTLMENNNGTSYGLVCMGSEAAVMVPVTTDQGTFFSRLDSLVLGTLGEGTAIGTGLSSAVYHLSASNAPKKCIVLITDGENNAGEIHPETAARLALDNNIALYVFGIGTRGSVPIEYNDPLTGKNYSGYLDSNFDSASLEKIARDANGFYYGIETLSSMESALSVMIKRQAVTQSHYLRTIDDFYYDKFLFVAMICFIATWFIRYVCLKEVY